MSASITLDDGRTYWGSNWAFDAVIRAIAAVLPGTPQGRALRDWLLDQQCRVQGPGIGCVDTRELTPDNRRLFAKAIEDAFNAQRRQGPIGWHDPKAWDVWLAHFSDLVKMVESIRRGEQPEAFNPHSKGVMPATNKHAGPGW